MKKQTDVSKLTAAEFLKRRAGTATGEGMAALLDLVPAREPNEGDELHPSQRT